jgi:antitoxin ParD1/3/4
MPITADRGARHESYVSKLVKQGHYSSRSEDLREGLRLLQEKEARLAAPDAAAARGLADARPTIPAAQTFAKFKAKYGKAK